MRYSSKQTGFTLLELLVVVIIIAILFTFAALAIRGNSAEDIIQEEAQRLDRLIQLVLEESILRGEEHALEIFLDGYRFLRFTEDQWLPLEDDRMLRERQLPKDMEIEISLEETEIVIDLAKESKNSQTLDSSTEGDQNNDENNTENNETKAKPQIFLLSSGEITPEFEIRFHILGVETSYLVTGKFDGSLETRKSDL